MLCELLASFSGINQEKFFLFNLFFSCIVVFFNLLNIFFRYFEDVLKSVSSSVEEIELLRDGSWGLPKVNDTISLCSDEDAAMADADDDDIMIVDPAKTKPSKTVDKKKTDSVSTESVAHQQEPPQPTVIIPKTSVIEPKQQRTSSSSNTSNAPKKKPVSFPKC